MNHVKEHTLDKAERRECSMKTNQKRINSKTRKIIMLVFFILYIILTISPQVRAEGTSRLYLDKLKFDVNINEDGSMNVVETWEIDISNVNTLYKTFEMDKDKFTTIENVSVKDVTANKEFTQINEEMYHVTKDCYYGLVNSKGRFEIAWGVDLEGEHSNKTYEISYTVKDAVAKYNDYAEIYWQFVGEDFEIDAEKITGTITFPSNVQKEEDIKVWGHTEDLNGEIYVTDTDEIKFQLENFNAGKYVEVRALFPKNMIETTGREYNKDIYEEVIKEETKWANQANLRRELEEIQDDVFVVFTIFSVLALCIIFIEKATKYGKKLSDTKKYVPEQKLEYYRELPEKNVTPGEALYILKEPYNNFSIYFGKIFSATLLNLKLKDYIDLRVEKIDNKKEKIFIKRLKEPFGNLKNDEKKILEFMYKAFKKQETEIEIKTLEKYIEKHPAGVENLINGCQKTIEKQLKESGMVDLKQKEEFTNYSGTAGVYYVFTILTLFWAIPLSIILLINGILCSKLKKNTNVLTKKGIESKEKWKGLKKYMEDFSLLNEKEVPAIEVWEHYLVYATVFGIADKVLKQLKTIYPHIDELDSLNTSAYMYFMYHCNFETSFSSSISSSISSSYSSGIGGGGGFSGGGRRRPEAGGGGGGR